MRRPTRAPGCCVASRATKSAHPVPRLRVDDRLVLTRKRLALEPHLTDVHGVVERHRDPARREVDVGSRPDALAIQALRDLAESPAGEILGVDPTHDLGLRLVDHEATLALAADGSIAERSGSRRRTSRARRSSHPHLRALADLPALFLGDDRPNAVLKARPESALGERDDTYACGLEHAERAQSFFGVAPETIALPDVNDVDLACGRPREKRLVCGPLARRPFLRDAESPASMKTRSSGRSASSVWRARAPAALALPGNTRAWPARPNSADVRAALAFGCRSVIVVLLSGRHGAGSRPARHGAGSRPAPTRSATRRPSS